MFTLSSFQVKVYKRFFSIRIRISLLSFIFLVISLPDATAKSNPAADSMLQQVLAIKDYPTKMQALYDACTKTYTDQPGNAKIFAEAFLAAEKTHPADSTKARAYFLQGDVALLLGDYKSSLEWCLKALPIAQQLKMYALEVEILSDISGVYLRTDDMPNSLKTIKEALAIARQQKLYPQQARMASFLAIRHLIMNNAAEGIIVLDSALTLAKNQRLFKLAENILESKATAYAMTEQMEKARVTFLEARHLADSLGLRNVQAAVRFHIANLYFFMNRFQESEQLAKEALSLSEDITDPAFFISVHKLLADIYSTTGDYKSAYKYLKQQKTLQDSIFTASKAAQIEELQTRYDTEVKDKTIATQSIQLSFNKKVNIFLWIGLLLLAIIGLLIYRTQRRTQRFNIRISKQSSELQSKSQELEALNSAKDRLFGVISHDLRTPVNSLISFTDLLESASLSPEKFQQYLVALKQSLGYTSDLLENLLYFAKTQIQAYQPNLKPVKIEEKIEEAVALNDPSILKKDIQVITDIQRGVITIADDQMVALILRNLISNAIKYSFSGGQIVISSWEKDNQVYCRIQDEGVGLAPELLAKLMDAGNNQLAINSTAGTAHEKGTGLGLTLCRTFITLLNGQLLVTSEEGKGTAFTLVLSSVKASAENAANHLPTSRESIL